MNSLYKIPGSKESAPQKMSLVAKSTYLLCSGAISTLIAILSLLLVFTLVSLLTTGTIPGVTIPAKIPSWGAAIMILVFYTITTLPLKALRYSLLPHKSYALSGEQSSPKYGDVTLWLAFFILSGWYISEHRTEIITYLENFPDWWRNFVDMVGPWFYQ